MDLVIDRAKRYRLIEETKIVTGCGALYQAMDLDLKRTVAVKCVNILGQTPAERKSNYQKAYSEVQAMVLMGTEDINIPRIFDAYYDEKSSILYIVMEWINGQTLSENMKCPERQFLQWMIDLCEILERMERRKLAHKDIKPDNIMITDRRNLYLIDFNISIGVSNLMEGSQDYKAPEMAGRVKYMGREKVDMFAIGVMLYEYYAGKVPVWPMDYAKNSRRGPDVWDLFIEPREKNPDISETVNAAIVKAMRMDPRQRYGRISELKNDLRKAVREFNGKRKN